MFMISAVLFGVGWKNCCSWQFIVFKSHDLLKASLSHFLVLSNFFSGEKWVKIKQFSRWRLTAALPDRLSSWHAGWSRRNPTGYLKSNQNGKMLLQVSCSVWLESGGRIDSCCAKIGAQTKRRTNRFAVVLPDRPVGNSRDKTFLAPLRPGGWTLREM